MKKGGKRFEVSFQVNATLNLVLSFADRVLQEQSLRIPLEGVSISASRHPAIFPTCPR